MAATEEQKQAAETLGAASAWMAECPVPGSGGDALFDTFGTWFEEACRHHGLWDAYEAQHAANDEDEEQPGDDATSAFWDAVLARV